MSGGDWTSGPPDPRGAQLAERIEHELPALLALARRLTGDDHDAHDVVQDTLERAWRARAALREPAAAGGWLRSILARQVVDAHRRRRDRPSGSPVELEDLLLPDVVEPAAVMIAAEDEGAIRAALRTLSTDDRVAVVLHDGEGWGTAELAELLGIGVEAAYKRVQRARVKLVAALAAPRSTHPPTGACAATRAQAHALIDGTVPEPARAALQAHLDSCPYCPASLQAAAGVVSGLRAKRGQEPIPAALRERLFELVREGDLAP